MNTFRMRPRFLRLPPVEPAPISEPEQTAEIVTALLEAKPEPKRFPEPLSSWRFGSGLVTRDDCVRCNAQRDDLNRLPIGRCSPECPVVES